MILKETLRIVAKAQFEELSKLETGVPREKAKEIDLSIDFAFILSGIRRCGKSTLLHQLAKKSKNFYYFNFEDTRVFNFEVSDFQKLNEVFMEEFGDSKYYFFDEIQNVLRWEVFVRQMLDKGKHFVITGSNASLLSKELGTKLTGRHLGCELFPFSFREMLEFTGQKPSLHSFEEYFNKGGFPQYLKLGRVEILQELLNDIIVRDIVARYKLKDMEKIKELAVYLLSNTGKEFSYNCLKKMFGFGSPNTTISFVSYLEDCYLLFTVPKFDYSLKNQIVNPKKVYSIDNGLSGINSASFSADRGRMLENMAFIHLKKNCESVFYYRNKHECDFVVKTKGRITEAIQVCFELTDDNKEREISGLVEALSEFNLKEGLILTYKQEDSISVNGKKIMMVPVWKWLLEQ